MSTSMQVTTISTPKGASNAGTLVMGTISDMRQKVIDEADELGWTHRRAPEVDTFDKNGEQLLLAWSKKDPHIAVSATRINGAKVDRVVDSEAATAVRCWLGSPFV